VCCVWKVRSWGWHEGWWEKCRSHKFPFHLRLFSNEKSLSQEGVTLEELHIEVEKQGKPWTRIGP